MDKLLVVKQNKYKGKQKGFSLFESLLALTLLGSGFLMYYSNNDKVEIQKAAIDYNKQSISFANKWAYNLTLKDSDYTNTKNSGNPSVYIPNAPEYTAYDKMQEALLTSNNSGKPYLIKSLDDNQIIKGKFQQVPCFLVYYNNNNSGNNEVNAIMYYVQAKGTNYKNQYDIAMYASRRTPNLMGFYTRDNTKSSKGVFDRNGLIDASGWTPNDTLLNLMKNNSCVPNYELANNSIFVNMQMLPLFNDKQLAVSGLKKTTDQSVATFTDTNKQLNSQYLPGHIFNNNTLKSDLNVQNNIIFADRTALNSIIQLSQTTDSNNNNMLRLGNGTSVNNNTAYVASSLQSNLTMKTGTPCKSDEVGKIITQGKEVLMNEEQGRSIVVCTHNETLCNQVGGYCYLSLKERKYTFTPGLNGGLEDQNGYFRCPAYAPYLNSYDAQSEKTKTEIFMNYPVGGGNQLYTTEGSTLPVSGINYVYSHDGSCGCRNLIGACCGNKNDDYRNVFEASDNLSPTHSLVFSRYNIAQVNNYPFGGNKNSYGYGSCNSQSLLCRNRDNALTSPILTTLNFSGITTGKSISISNSSYVPDYGGNSSSTTPIGVKRNTGTNSCSYLCDSLNYVSQYPINDSARWVELTASSFYVAQPNIIKPQNTCACAKFGGGNVTSPNGDIVTDPYIYGLAYINYQQANNLTSVTCSTVGSYVIK